MNCLIWNILCCCFKNWLLGYFSYSFFVKECKFSFKILKWQQTWKFSEFQKSPYKIVIFWSIQPKLNYLYFNECVYYGFHPYLGVRSNLDYFENTQKHWNYTWLTYHFSILTVTGVLRDVISKKRQINIVIMNIIYTFYLQTPTTYYSLFPGADH